MQNNPPPPPPREFAEKKYRVRGEGGKRREAFVVNWAKNCIASLTSLNWKFLNTYSYFFSNEKVEINRSVCLSVILKKILKVLPFLTPRDEILKLE